MAVATQHSTTPTSAASRRFSIGANVTLSIIAAAALLVLVNWFGTIKYFREDLATYGNYGLSERTRSVLDSYQEPIEISMVYLPDDEDEQQRTYISRLRDYFDEMTRFARHVRVSPVATDSQREKLVARISTTFGSEADKHKEALADYDELSAELQTDLQQKLLAAQTLMSAESWLGDFPIFASIVNTLRTDTETLLRAGEEIKDLTPAAGIPKYAEAIQKAREALAEVKNHLQLIERRLGDLAGLADETVRPDSRYITMLREVAGEAKSLVVSLRMTVGSEKDPMPSDPVAALKAFADRGVEVGKGLDALSRRVDEFAQRYPMVTQHPNWAASAQMGQFVTRLDVGDVLKQAGQTLGKSRLVILGIIDSGDKNQLQRALVDARASCNTLEKNVSICEDLLKGLASRLSNLDAPSKELLDAARHKALFSDRVAAVEKLVGRFDELPELKLGSVADQLKQPNIVVIEASDRIRVVDFSEVWPVRESITGARVQDAPRTFNGDSAISSAILAMTRDGPFATVVITAFEPPAPQQRNQFMPPPPQSWVPASQLSELRKRLETANFKVVDWNLATSPEPPPTDEGAPNVYVCLPPPPPSPPNPFGESQPPDQIFGESQRQIIRNLLENDASVLFVASWEVRSSGFFGGPPISPPYGYAPILENDWGIAVDSGRRITWVEPDRTKANSFFVNPKRFIHMPANGVTDNPIGHPMRGTRLLITDACPLIIKPDRPEGIRTRTVLFIGDSENYIGPNMSQLVEIIEKLQQGVGQGSVTILPPAPGGPFDVMLAVERTVEDQPRGRLVVMGFGASIRDDYLRQPVIPEGDQLRLDPPPTENADLFVNALYWLSGQPHLISRGPVPVPRIEQIAGSDLTVLRVIVWAVWPALVFAPGIFLWYIRRR